MSTASSKNPRMMNDLPVEVIGHVLSLLGDARAVIRASATTRKWREAFHRHLRTLSFNYRDDRFFNNGFTIDQLETLITRTIFQTNGLQDLSISMPRNHKFSGSVVMAWLMHTRKTLCRLFYNIKTEPNINVLDICGRQNLGVLNLSCSLITGFEPNFQRFPCLRSLTLNYVGISELDLNLLLMACTKIETLELIHLKFPNSIVGLGQTIVLSSLTLKTVYVEAIRVDKFILQATNIESLHLKDCKLGQLELIGRGTMKHFKIDSVRLVHFNVGEVVDNLEILDVCDLEVIWSGLLQTLLKSSRLRRLRLWRLQLFADETIDFEMFADYFPQLDHLSLSYDPRYAIPFHGVLLYDFKESSYHLNNVDVLELWWDVLGKDFWPWLEELLIRCPNSRKLIIHGIEEEVRESLANLTSSSVQLWRRYDHVDVQFEYH